MFEARSVPLGGIQAKFDMVWLGWPGADFGDAEKDIVANEAMKQGRASLFIDIFFEFPNCMHPVPVHFPIYIYIYINCLVVELKMRC